MADLVERQDRIQSTIDTLLTQYRNSPVISGVYASYGEQIQELETVFISLWVAFMLPVAVGVQLDTLGKIVGEKRLARTDDEYRVAIGSRVRINHGNGTVEAILDALVNGADYDYWLSELFPASLNLQVMASISDDIADGIYKVLQDSRSGGVAASIVWTSDINNVLKLASGDVMESAPGLGLADTASTTGGILAGYRYDK